MVKDNNNLKQNNNEKSSIKHAVHCSNGIMGTVPL